MNANQTDLKTAFKTLQTEIQTDPDYAWARHCNIAMCIYDENIDHDAANKAASRFMDLCFGAKGYEKDLK